MSNLEKYVPKMYKKTIYDVNYDLLKENGIKCLIYDLDNTLLKVDKSIPKKDICDLIKKLKRDFNIYIISNNSSKKRIGSVADRLGIEYVSFALKPFSKGFSKVRKLHNYKKTEMCIIGDQIMTDILGGNRYGIYTVLLEPLSKEELKVTLFNRFLEKKALKGLSSKGLFKKGEYYE